ncbi:MAG TPA: alkaline phosphatase family protein [Acidimicrobiia bacterium]|nr:alkaline phosphatase family protein [Acidimicrobiia bacterium]
MSFRSPDYGGGNLLNLVAEIEGRLGGSPPHPPLTADIAASVPDAASYVLVLFDGLGDRQLEHPAAAALRATRVAAIDSPFPATTTVSMATIATGLSPAEHGLLGYQLWMPDLGEIANTIIWSTMWGAPLEYETGPFLPAPNLWERLGAAGIEPITLQPWNFERSPMSRMLYRGARFEPWADEDDAVEAATSLAAVPGRLVFLYVPHVDFAAHVGGQHDSGYHEAMEIVDRLWDRLARHLPPGTAAIGTADHGHVDIPLANQVEIPRAAQEDLVLYGDARTMLVRGDGAALAADLPATWVPLVEMEHWWGPGDRHSEFDSRAPDGVLVADDGFAILHRHSDDSLIGQHGAPTDAELRVPVLVAAAD